MDDFLRQELHTEEGVAITSDGEKVGLHDGALLYTLGTRIPLRNAEAGPWYVIAKDVAHNTLTVSKEHFTKKSNAEITLRDTNWFTNPLSETTYAAQYRYHGPRISGTYDSATNMFTPIKSIDEPLASGQSLVLYADDECIGGGIIV